MSSLPALDRRVDSARFTDTDSTALGRGIAPVAAAHVGASGIHPLPNARDAFAARVLLARAAERSLDIQYYIWRNDLTGTLLFQELYAAANRGVRVRVLLDDNNTAGLDATLGRARSTSELRSSAVQPARSPRTTRDQLRHGLLARQSAHAQQVLHGGKSSNDIGGRNVGDEYFDATRRTPSCSPISMCSP